MPSCLLRYILYVRLNLVVCVAIACPMRWMPVPCSFNPRPMASWEYPVSRVPVPMSTMPIPVPTQYWIIASEAWMSCYSTASLQRLFWNWRYHFSRRRRLWRQRLCKGDHGSHRNRHDCESRNNQTNRQYRFVLVIDCHHEPINTDLFKLPWKHQTISKILVTYIWFFSKLAILTINTWIYLSKTLRLIFILGRLVII